MSNCSICGKEIDFDHLPPGAGFATHDGVGLTCSSGCRSTYKQREADSACSEFGHTPTCSHAPQAPPAAPRKPKRRVSSNVWGFFDW